jgi:hypothetical protein
MVQEDSSAAAATPAETLRKGGGIAKAIVTAKVITLAIAKALLNGPCWLDTKNNLAAMMLL